jgi:hypothetical protein
MLSLKDGLDITKNDTKSDESNKKEEIKTKIKIKRESILENFRINQNS